VLAFPLFAQKKYKIVLETDQAHFFKNLPSDSLLLIQKIEELKKNFYQKGFLEAKLNACIFGDGKANIDFFVGKKYTWGLLKKGNLPDKIAQKIGFSEKKMRKKDFNWYEIEAIFTKILAFSQNTGYPFAEVFLDSLQLKEQKFAAQIHYKSNEQVRFDSLMLYGKLNIKPKFLKNYLRLSYQTTFSQAQLDQAEEMLKNLSFLKFIKKPTVFFLYNRAYWQLFLDKKNSNEADGIIGFLPNPQDNSFLITGQAQLKLDNLFASAKSLQLNWQRLRPESQLLDLSYQHPAFLATPLDVSFTLNLNKQDSSFLNISQLVEIIYRFKKSKLGFFYQNKESNTSDTVFRSQENIPKIHSFSWQNYGIFFEIKQFDAIFQPQKGWFAKFSVALGNKKLTLQNFSQHEYSTHLQKYFRTGKNSTFLIDFQAKILNSEQLFINEFYQLGGFRRLRGFNENSFFVSRYMLLSEEFRLYFAQNSSLFAFVDHAFFFSQQATGFGAGMSFQTQNGIFRFMYALGSSQNQVLSLQNSKIHFGLTGRF